MKKLLLATVLLGISSQANAVIYIGADAGYGDMGYTNDHASISFDGTPTSNITHLANSTLDSEESREHNLLRISIFMVLV